MINSMFYEVNVNTHAVNMKEVRCWCWMRRPEVPFQVLVYPGVWGQGSAQEIFHAKKCISSAVLFLFFSDIATMSQGNLQQDFQNQVNDVFSRLQNKQMFQSDWDIASFAIFFIFIGESVFQTPAQHHSWIVKAIRFERDFENPSWVKLEQTISGQIRSMWCVWPSVIQSVCHLTTDIKDLIHHLLAGLDIRTENCLSLSLVCVYLWWRGSLYTTALWNTQFLLVVESWRFIFCNGNKGMRVYNCCNVRLWAVLFLGMIGRKIHSIIQKPRVTPHIFLLYILLGKWSNNTVIYFNMHKHTCKHWILHTEFRSLGQVNIWSDHRFSSTQPEVCSLHEQSCRNHEGHFRPLDWTFVQFFFCYDPTLLKWCSGSDTDGVPFCFFFLLIKDLRMIPQCYLNHTRMSNSQEAKYKSTRGGARLLHSTVCLIGRNWEIFRIGVQKFLIFIFYNHTFTHLDY